MPITGYKDEILSALEEIINSGEVTPEGIYNGLETQGFIEESADEMPLGEEEGLEEGPEEGMDEMGGMGGPEGMPPLGEGPPEEGGAEGMPADTRIMAVRAALSDDADKKKKAAEERVL